MEQILYIFLVQTFILKMNYLALIVLVECYLLTLQQRKLKSSASIYLWNKKPRIKATTLQRHKPEGGVNLPNFEWYAWCFALRPFTVWVNSASQVSWCPIEERLTHQYNLTDFILTIPQKIVKCDFGPIITYIIIVWHKVNKLTQVDKLFCQCCIFCNYSLVIDGKPIIFPHWSDKGVHSI